MIIFIDVDGVLATQRSYALKLPGREPAFDRDCVAALNLLTQRVRGQLVVSSQWRIGRSVAELQAIFTRNEVRAPVIGKTAEHPRGRGYEIQRWLRAYAAAEALTTPPAYLVVDDETWQLDAEVPPERLLIVAGGFTHGGLTKLDVLTYLERRKPKSGGK